MDFINPESAENMLKKVGMKKSKMYYHFISTKKKNRKIRFLLIFQKPQSHLSN
jgi:hypothetical protein